MGYDAGMTEIGRALLAKARTLTGITDDAALLHEALKRLVRQEAARRLARLAGSEPGLKDIPRRRARRT